MARNAAKPSPSQHPPSTTLQSNINIDSHVSTRIATDPNTSDAVSRKRLKSSSSSSSKSAGRGQTQTHAAGPLHRPPPQLINQPALSESDIIPPPYIERHVLGHGGAPGLVEATATSSPNMMQRQQQQAGGNSSDRRDWAPQQPGPGEESSDHGPRGGKSPSGSKATSTPTPPLLTQHAPGVKAATVDEQNITSLTRDKGSQRGQKRRVPDGETEAESDQKRLLNIVQDLDKLEKEQKDFGKQQLQAIREGSV